MAEPENQTLHLLRELRAGVKTLEDRFDKLEKKVDSGFARIGERFEHLDERFERVDMRLNDVVRGLGNEVIQGKFITAGIDQRFTQLEERIAALEQR